MTDPYQQQPGSPDPQGGHEQLPPSPYPPYQPQPQQYVTQPYGQPYGNAPVEHPQGTVILILGILGFVTAITGVIAWVMGNKAVKEIQTGKANGIVYSNESSVNIGRILGIVTSVLAIAGIVITIVAFIIMFAVLANIPSY